MTVQSCNGSLEYGLTACRRAVHDLTDLTDHVVAEHRALLARIIGAEADAPTAKSPAAARVVEEWRRPAARKAGAAVPKQQLAAAKKAAKKAAPWHRKAA